MNGYYNIIRMEEISEQDFKELKEEFNKAVSKNRPVFIFKQERILTNYARYLIEFLTDKFKK